MDKITPLGRITTDAITSHPFSSTLMPFFPISSRSSIHLSSSDPRLVPAPSLLNQLVDHARWGRCGWHKATEPPLRSPFSCSYKLWVLRVLIIHQMPAHTQRHPTRLDVPTRWTDGYNRQSLHYSSLSYANLAKLRFYLILAKRYLTS